MWAGIRQAQLSAASLPMVGFSTNADRAQGCDVHPPAKQDCARRLAHSALGLVYKNPSIAWRSPTFKSQAAADDGSVTITLKDVSAEGLHELFPWNYHGAPGVYFNGSDRSPGAITPLPLFDCAAQDKAGPGTCAWAAVQTSSGDWVNATITMKGKTVTFTPKISCAIWKRVCAARGTAYAWGSVPMMSLYDAGTHLPVIGWNTSVP